MRSTLHLNPNGTIKKVPMLKLFCYLFFDIDTQTLSVGTCRSKDPSRTSLLKTLCKPSCDILPVCYLDFYWCCHFGLISYFASCLVKLCNRNSCPQRSGMLANSAYITLIVITLDTFEKVSRCQLNFEI